MVLGLHEDRKDIGAALLIWHTYPYIACRLPPSGWPPSKSSPEASGRHSNPPSAEGPYARTCKNLAPLQTLHEQPFIIACTADGEAGGSVLCKLHFLSHHGCVVSPQETLCEKLPFSAKIKEQNSSIFHPALPPIVSISADGHMCVCVCVCVCV